MFERKTALAEVPAETDPALRLNFSVVLAPFLILGIERTARTPESVADLAALADEDADHVVFLPVPLGRFHHGRRRLELRSARPCHGTHNGPAKDGGLDRRVIHEALLDLWITFRGRDFLVEWNELDAAPEGSVRGIGPRAFIANEPEFGLRVELEELVVKETGGNAVSGDDLLEDRGVEMASLLDLDRRDEAGAVEARDSIRGWGRAATWPEEDLEIGGQAVASADGEQSFDE